MELWIERGHTFVMLTVGSEIPIKKPKTAPTIVTTISLMLSLGFLMALEVKEQRWKRKICITAEFRGKKR